MRFCVIVCLVIAAVVTTAVPGQKPSEWRGKLLVIPMDGSHWTGVKAVSEELGRKGHEVTVVIPEISMRLGPGKHYITKTFPVNYDADYFKQVMVDVVQELTFPEHNFIKNVISKFNHLRKMFQFMASTTESLLTNQELMTFLREQNYDAVLTDPALPMGALVGYNLSVPTVYMLRGMPASIESAATGVPSPPSYVPRFFTKYTDHMTFSQRVGNVMMTLIEPVLLKVMYQLYEDISYNFLQKDMSFTEVLNTASLWLMRYDFTLEYPKPLMPNMQLVGGINCDVKNPLSKEVAEFVEGSGEHGVVVFTLGSMVSSMPAEKAVLFFEAFSRIPQRVLWRFTGEVPEKVPENVKLMKWLPQNDLLGHPKARAFITHGGTHGIYEGICNGVPMVMLPLFGDQTDNVHRMATRGVGVILNIHEVTAETLVDALNAVINDTSYKEKMSKLSAIHNDRPVQPLDLAVFWTEFVMRNKGADHLRSAAIDLNWFQYHSLDVMGFLLLVLVLVAVAMVKCCAVCWRRCCRTSRKRKAE